MLGLVVTGCPPSAEIARPRPDQCPADTFPDNSAAGKASVTVSGDVNVRTQTGGAAVSTSGEGNARYTCRQKCPSGALPFVEESSSPSAGTTFKYHCNPQDGKPGSDYEEAHKPDGTATGKILTASALPDAGR